MIDAMRSPTPGCELAAPGRDGRAVAMPDAPAPLSRREAHARRQAASRPASGRKRPGRARSRIRTREIVAAIIYVRPVEVAARIVRLQLAETFVIAREAADYADVVHVALTHEGVTGYGEAAPVERYDESAESALRFVDDHGGLVGDDPFALEDIGERLAAVPGEQAAK